MWCVCVGGGGGGGGECMYSWKVILAISLRVVLFLEIVLVLVELYTLAWQFM